MGVAGALDPDGLLVTVQNHSGNKLDWFLQPVVDVHRRGGAQRQRLSVDLALENRVPAGEPRYVTGGDGHYRAFVAVYLPARAHDVRVAGEPMLVAGRDGPMRVVAVRVDLARGQRRTVHLEFSLPADVDHLDLLPSARARPMRVRFDGRAVDDGRAVRLGW